MKIKLFLILSLFAFNQIKSQNIVNPYSNRFNIFLDSIEKLIGYRWYPTQKPIDSIMAETFTHFVSNNRQDIKSHFLLMILAESYPDQYQVIHDTIKVAAFCSCFSQSNKMNYWSVLKPKASQYAELYAGRLFLDLGRGIIPCLSKYLRDTTRSEFGWNAESRSYNLEYRWRRKDFAYRYCAIVLGEMPIFLKRPEERDIIIDDFVEKYKKYLYVK